MTRVLLLYGGRSGEHQISCLSARSVLEAIDTTRYEVVPVGITRNGRWTLTDGVIEPIGATKLPEVADDGPTVALIGTRQGPQLVRVDDDGTSAVSIGPIDVVFPLMHGPWGEDGTIQGMLDTIGVPYVGADVAASSFAIDKAAMKAAFAAHDLPQGPYVAVDSWRWRAEPQVVVKQFEESLALPWFVKPVRQGSSIGISKVSSPDRLAQAMEAAYAYDKVAVVEQGFVGARELEVGVLGDGEIHVTRPGEIVPSHEFYDFDAKYLDTSQLRIPAEVPPEVAAEIDVVARRAYRAIGCRGLARVDFFLAADGQLVINEINTIPGFTPSSMFPRLWAAEGLDYPALVARLLESATETYA